MLLRIVVTVATVVAIGAVVVLGIAVWLLGTSQPLPVDPAWAVAGDRDVPPGAVTVRFTGTSTLLFSDGRTSWMVDGWFSRFGPLTLVTGTIAPDVAAIERGLSRNAVDRLAVVIPVHSHFDHAMDAPEVARRTGALLLGSPSTAWIGRGWGLDERQIRVAVDREPLRFGDFTITLIETEHFEFPDPEVRARALGEPRIEAPLVPPVNAFDYRVGQPYAIHVRHPKGSFLIQGSAGFRENGLAGFAADTVFLGVGGLGTQTDAYRDRYWQETVVLPGAGRVIPIHFDSLTAPIDGPFVGEVRAAGFLSSGGDRLRDFLEERRAAMRAADPEFRILTLPRYDPVVLYR